MFTYINEIDLELQYFDASNALANIIYFHLVTKCIKNIELHFICKKFGIYYVLGLIFNTFYFAPQPQTLLRSILPQYY